MKTIPASRREKLRNRALGHRPGHTGQTWHRFVIPERSKSKGRPARKPKEKK